MSNASIIAAGRLYRIMDFSRVVQLFEREELYFSYPTAWDDQAQAFGALLRGLSPRDRETAIEVAEKLSGRFRTKPAGR